MAIYEVQTPEGKIFEVEAPTPAAAHEALRSRFAPQPDQITTMGNISHGFVRGAKDPIDAGAQLLTHGLEGLAPEGSWFERYMKGQRELVDRLNAEGEAGYQKDYGNAPGAAGGRLAGNVVATSPVAMAMPGSMAPGIAARTASGLASGAVTGALQPVGPENTEGSKFWDAKIGQTAEGAAGGAVAPAAFGGVARTISPKLSPEIQSLMAQKVKLTPGQLAGPTANRIEEGMQSIPLLGDVVRSARRGSIESFNRAATDRALGHIGEKVNPNTAIGRESVDEAHSKISAAYDRLLPQLTIRADPAFANNLLHTLQNINHLEPGLVDSTRTIIRDKLMRHFSPGGGMTGEGYKEAEGELGRLASDYMNSGTASERQMGGAIKQVQAELKDLLLRSNPAHREQLSAINAAYADLLRVEGAAAKTGAVGGGHQMGVFTPAQLNQSVRALDPSLRKSAFARGEARMQDLGDTARVVLGDKVPDSGTPFRGYLGLPALLAASHADPTGLSFLPAVAGAGVGAAYTPAGRSIMEHLLARRPPGAAAAASLVRSPVTTPLAAILAQSER